MISPEGNEGVEDFRRGGEDPDARIGSFDVYGGSPQDRAELQAGDPDRIGDLDAELRLLIKEHQDETGSELPE